MTDIHHMITELTRTHIVQTPYTTYHNGELQTAYHYSKAPALLVQLQHSTPTLGNERNNAGFGSRPAAHIEALDTLMHIDKEAAAWVRFLGHDDPGTTAACVSRVGGLYPAAGDQQNPIARAVRSWWNQARICTGYDTPAWRPDNTCPLCGERGTLRVKLANHAALCVAAACFETWDEATIGLLADHILAENGEEPLPLTTDPDEAA